MTRHFSVWGVVSIVTLVAATGLAADPPAEKKPTKESPALPTTKKEFAALADDLPLPPWLPCGGNHRKVANEQVYGTVVDVGSDSIEVRPSGKKEAVKYPVHVLLETGAVCHWEGDSCCYLLPDVKKGDEVMLRVGTVDKEKGLECFCIKISKRPGDVVPPSRKPSGDYPYHVNQQAWIDHEEKGIHLPQHLQPKRDPPNKKPVAPPPAGALKKKD